MIGQVVGLLQSPSGMRVRAEQYRHIARQARIMQVAEGLLRLPDRYQGRPKEREQEDDNRGREPDLLASQAILIRGDAGQCPALVVR